MKTKIRKVKEYRILKDMTQEDIANILGITPNTYSLKENKKRGFTLKEALILSNLYEVSVNDIFTIEDIE